MTEVEGSSAELAFSVLLDAAGDASLVRRLADAGELRHLAAALRSSSSSASSSSSSARLRAVLVAARLAARSTAAQMDLVREGAAGPLVDIISRGGGGLGGGGAAAEDGGRDGAPGQQRQPPQPDDFERAQAEELRAHAARLLAILSQHPSTHQRVCEAGALQAVVRIIAAARDAAVRAAGGQPIFAEREARQRQQAAAVDAAAASNGGGSAAVAAYRFYRSNGVAPPSAAEHFSAAQAAAAADKADDENEDGENGDEAAAPIALPAPSAALLEQATSVVAVLAHNPNNHFDMVSAGLVPALVPLLARPRGGHAPASSSPAASKTQTYALAALLLLAMHETRHAAVVARAGAAPALAVLARDPRSGPVAREFSGALLATLARSPDVQIDLVASGAIPACVRLLAEGTAEARCHAAEALLQMAAVSDVRRRLVARAGAMGPLAEMLRTGGAGVGGGTGTAAADDGSNKQPRTTPRAVVQLWAAQLMSTLAGEPSVLAEVARSPACLSALTAVLGEAAVAATPAVAPRELEKARAHAAWLLARLADNPWHRSALTSMSSVDSSPAGSFDGGDEQQQVLLTSSAAAGGGAGGLAEAAAAVAAASAAGQAAARLRGEDGGVPVVRLLVSLLHRPPPEGHDGGGGDDGLVAASSAAAASAPPPFAPAPRPASPAGAGAARGSSSGASSSPLPLGNTAPNGGPQQQQPAPAAAAAAAARSGGNGRDTAPESLAGDQRAAAAAALLALCRGDADAQREVLGELSLQMWMGRDVRLDGLRVQDE
jgi:hypothetical protein